MLFLEEIEKDLIISSSFDKITPKTHLVFIWAPLLIIFLMFISSGFGSFFILNKPLNFIDFNIFGLYSKVKFIDNIYLTKFRKESKEEAGFNFSTANF